MSISTANALNVGRIADKGFARGSKRVGSLWKQGSVPQLDVLLKNRDRLWAVLVLIIYRRREIDICYDRG
jgi:hypothetical protein